VLESCSALRNADVLDSETYVIDPDGEKLGDDPFAVQCDMDIEPVTGVTVLGHDSEGRLRVAPCEEAGCYSRHIIYNQASIDQLRALTEVSESCEQFVRLDCRHICFIQSGLELVGLLEWTKYVSLGRAEINSSSCACGMTGICIFGLCNCDSSDHIWRTDEGYLWVKSLLPVKSVYFGDIQDAPLEMAFHTIGKLTCKGKGKIVRSLELRAYCESDSISSVTGNHFERTFSIVQMGSPVNMPYMQRFISSIQNPFSDQVYLRTSDFNTLPPAKN
ncbi:versican core protein-like isoform X1, partial [Acipenser oxyrinchus oxyrinchus]